MGNKLVYSTDPSWKPPCEACGRTPCACADPVKRRQPEPVRVFFQRLGKGSGVTRIERLNMHPQGKEDFLRALQKKFGCGGTVKLGAIELQGDRRDAVEAELVRQGYKVKRIGG